MKALRDHAFYQNTKLKTFTIPQSVTRIEDNAFSYPTTTTICGVPGSYAETYAKWKAFIPILPDNAMGPNGELLWEYAGGRMTVTGPLSAQEPLFAACYTRSGQLLSLGVITSDGDRVSVPEGTASCKLFWVGAGNLPKCPAAFVSLKTA